MAEPFSRWSDEDLDRLWDNLAEERVGEPADGTLGDLLATVRYVTTHDDTQGPRAAFVERLRLDLRSRTSKEAMRSTTAVPVSPGRRLHVPEGMRPTVARRTSNHYRGIAQLAAAVLTIALVASFAFSHRPHGQFAAVVSPPSTPIAAATTAPPTGMLQGDAARTGAMPGPGPVGVPSIVWRVSGNSGAYGPVIAGNRIFSIQARGNATPTADVVAMDVRTGATLWTASVGANSFTTPSVGNGLVYVPREDGVVALDEDTGSTVWTHQLGAGINSASPTVTKDLVYVTARDQTLRAIDAMTGKEAWRVPLPASTTYATIVSGQLSNTTSPAVEGGSVYAIGNGGLLVASDANDGHQLWTFQLAGDDPGTPSISGGLVFVTSGHMGSSTPSNAASIQAIDASTGALAWQFNDSSLSLFSVEGGGGLYLTRLSNGEGVVDALDPTTGKSRWTYRFATDGPIGGLVFSSGALYLASSDGTFLGIDAASGKLVWSVRLADANGPLVADGLLIVAGQETIYAVGQTSIAATMGTPSSMPSASTPTDLSDRPPCVPLRTVPAKMPTGSPKATLAAETKIVGKKDPGAIAQILVSNLPEGTPASAEEMAGIGQTLTGITNCMPTANETDRIAGFFTDDFYRRGEFAGGSGSYFLSWPAGGGIGKTAALNDGRIAVQILLGAKPHVLLIFAQQNGRWLVDERYNIVPVYAEAQG